MTNPALERGRLTSLFIFGKLARFGGYKPGLLFIPRRVRMVNAPQA
jgi:hypothetical protein